MTQSPTGGPASTTYQVTSRQGVIGRDAQRVVIVTDGRAAEGGPQQAAYFVSDAEIAAGDFVVTGNKPLPIVLVGAQGAEYPPIAYYNVTGKADDYQPPQSEPEPPAGDPIGDALRADAVAYWTLNESDQPYLDSTAFNHPLVSEEIGFFQTIAGKVGNAVGYVDSTDVVAILFTNDSIGTLSGASLSFWLKISTSFGAEFSTDLIETPFNNLKLSCDGANSIFIRVISGPSGEKRAVVAGQWYHLVITSDSLNHNLYINGVLTDTIVSQRTSAAYFGNFLLTSGNNTIDYYYLDEFAVIDRIIDTDEIAYLYNSGAGRALFPAP